MLINVNRGPWRIALPAGTATDNSGTVVTNPTLVAQIGNGTTDFTTAWSVPTTITGNAASGRYVPLDNSNGSFAILPFTAGTQTLTFTVWRCYETGSASEYLIKAGSHYIGMVENACRDISSLTVDATNRQSISVGVGGDYLWTYGSQVRLANAQGSNLAGIVIAQPAASGVSYKMADVIKLSTNGACGVFFTVSARSTSNAGVLIKVL